MDVWTFKSCGSVVKNRKVEQIEWWNGTNVNFNRIKEKYYKLCWFSRICHVIKYFTDLRQTFGKSDITFPLSSGSRDIEWRKPYELIRTVCGSNWYKPIQIINNQ